jgi:3-hydroxyisobutyrate dehydrogenase
MTNITWIGLGQMGLPMALNLQAAGHTVTGVEVSPAAAAAARREGLELVDELVAAVTGADMVFTMLPNGDLVNQVLVVGGVLDALATGTLVIDCSTLDVGQAKVLHDEAGRRGLVFLDAPVSGGVSGATAGTLAIMVGGREDAVAVARPVLEVMGASIFHVGGAGAGQTAKLVNNMILGINLAATCEGVALAERLGLDTQVLFDVLTRSSGDSWAIRTWYPSPGVVDSSAANRDWVPGFSTSLLVKDLGLALKAGLSVGGSLRTANLVHQLFSDHAAANGAALDCSSLITTMRDPADIATTDTATTATDATTEAGSR